MRICLYTSESLPKVGGQELVVDALAREFSVLGNEVVVLAPRRRGWKTFSSNSLPYTVAWHPRFFSTRHLVFTYAHWLARLQRRHNFDIIHCHDTYPSAYVASCCRAAASVPIVVTSHGGDLDPDSLLYRKPQLRARYEQALRRADAAITLSKCVEDRFRCVLPEFDRFESIPNGVDLLRFSGETRRPETLPGEVGQGEYLLFMGRLEPRKGADLLLDAFAKVAGGNRVKLIVAGEGSQRPALEHHAISLGLDDRVYFTGLAWGDTKTWLLENMLGSVVPSRIAETFPLVVLESGAAGRPVIGTGLPGLSEIISPNRTGLIVPEGSTAELACALDQLIGDREAASRLGREALAIARSYSWSKIAGRHLKLFKELIRRRGAKGGP